ncbi:hypothetical protein FBALC1_11612 [Flavobacteriales bacterium ALC-1]|nr:hypothetical protein FBALC1_11612 [Flavobacteriales bacterium ALC-1]
MLNRLTLNTDILGAGASTLCLIHCAATPFLFVAKACSVTCCSDTPAWWQTVDYFFIVVSFTAIYFTTKHATKNWLRLALWSSWTLLLFAIVNETFQVILLSELFIYVPAIAIVVLHLYNLKYCKCADDTCCTN